MNNVEDMVLFHSLINFNLKSTSQATDKNSLFKPSARAIQKRMQLNKYTNAKLITSYPIFSVLLCFIQSNYYILMFSVLMNDVKCNII